MFVYGSPSVKQVILSSAGNPTKTFTTMTGTLSTFTTGWTVNAATVTVKITCNGIYGAASIGLDDITYGAAGVAKPGNCASDVISKVDLSLSKDIAIYPNPASNLLTLSNLPLNAAVSVFAIDGKMVTKFETSKDNRKDINVSRWNKGVYLFHIESKNGKTIKKVVVE
jgi:hypothetical protein